MISILSKSRFETFNSIIARRRRWVILAWIIGLALAATLIPSFFANVSYNITSVGGGPTNSESQTAQNILNAQFPSTSNTSDNTILVVLQNASVYSTSVKDAILRLNQTLSTDKGIGNFSGTSSIYDTETSLLNSTIPSLISEASILSSNISTINSGVYTLDGNLTTLGASLFMLEQGVNQTSQLIFGIPDGFVQTWQGEISGGVTNPFTADSLANSSIFLQTNDFNGSQESIGYYRSFYSIWNSSFISQPSPTTPTPLAREQAAINQSVSALISSPGLNNQTIQLIQLTGSGLNVTDWDNSNSVANVTISSIASNVPPQLSSTFGVTPVSLVTQLYDFGPSPTNATLSNYTISLFENTIPQSANFSSSSLIRDSYNLGPSPNSSSTFNLASFFVANSTGSAFSGSPLFSTNATSLGNFLLNLGPNATSTKISQGIQTLVSNEQFFDFPFVPSKAVTSNFVSPDNNTMIIIFNFSSSPDKATIINFRTDVQNSGLSSLGKTYVTGSAVLTQDISDVFGPALGITIVPGIIVALIIVGLLFLSPIAAIVPILVGGFAIGIGYPAIYIGIVLIQKQNITFLTPTLATLLMLGLAVDYAVLQLRRTKEERQKGKTSEQSVAISAKWAGQAVLTAGITVIVAYIVMAVANVPLFSGVGWAIAIGVSILLLASLTLLPALELSLGDRIFWPSMRPTNSSKMKKDRLGKVADATLKRKVAITIVISALALGAFYVTYTTPIGADFLKLVPNFQSNQGLTVISNSLGSGSIAPTVIVVLTPSPIVSQNGTFNQSLLNKLEQISAAAAKSPGVLTVQSPTRPFGNTFDYSAVSSMPEAIKAQYESGMLSDIGINNETATVLVGLSSSSQSAQAISSLLSLEKNVNDLHLTGITIYYGGSTQSTYDSQSFIVGLLPEVILILAAAVYVILFLQLRSAFTPIRLIFTILCSVVFSLAILSLIFYYGLGLPILDFAPLFVVVTMLGVGIDYDIFFVTRIREEVLNGKTDNQAIKTAVQRVWVTILGIGLVLSTVFASLVVTGIAILQEISLAVSLAIMIDVLVVILFFVPSLMGLAQRFNWWPSKRATRTQS